MTTHTITVEKLSENDGGGWFATIKELPGCMSDGETPWMAIGSLLDGARPEWIDAATRTGVEFEDARKFVTTIKLDDGEQIMLLELPHDQP